jgi:hypothetical protein
MSRNEAAPDPLDCRPCQRTGPAGPVDRRPLKSTGCAGLDAGIDQMMRGVQLPIFPAGMTMSQIEVPVKSGST